MKTTPAKVEFARLPKNYAELCRILTPRPLHDDVEFQNVTEITDAMAGHNLTPDQEDYFDLLCRLIGAAHFNRQIVYTLRFMTHAEYSKDRWKDTL